MMPALEPEANRSDPLVYCEKGELVVRVALLWRIGLALSGSTPQYSEKAYDAMPSRVCTRAHIGCTSPDCDHETHVASRTELSDIRALVAQAPESPLIRAV